MRLPTKAEITEKLLDFSLVRLLIYERWFRFGFLAFILVFALIGFCLPKIWTTSRPEFLPVIKVSVLDLLQARSLKRTAVKQAAAGKFDDANYAWQAALANNRADPDLVRGALHCILADPHNTKLAGNAIQESFWLLRLTETNMVDLALACNVFERYKYYEAVVQFTESQTNTLSSPVAASYLKALFSLSQMYKFDQQWEKYKDSVSKDPEIALYRAAYLAGWGPPGEIGVSRAQLESAANDPKTRVVAHQLKLVLSAEQSDPVEYGKSLAKLEEWHEATFSFHYGYWRLLLVLGQKEKAAQLVRDYPHPPRSPIEVVQLAEIYERLGMREDELQLLQRYARDFGNVPVFWMSYASALTETKRWEDLRNMALQIRDRDGIRDSLGSFSYFLEGRAELELGREANALSAFHKAVEREFPYPALGHKVASQLQQLGYPELARQILLGLEKQLKTELVYWTLLFNVAERLRDMDLMLKAASHAFEIAPKNPAVINNYAAALIINRQNPAQAIKLTMQLFADHPESLYAVVNHSAALLQNERPKQAEELLSRINTNSLDRTQLNLYHLDLFETYYSLREFDRAWSISDQIDAQLLYPPQQKWLNQTLQKLPPKQKKG